MIDEPASKEPGNESQDEPGAASDQAAQQQERGYEPPRLTRIGNLRDLLGKSGGMPESSQTNPTKA